MWRTERLPTSLLVIASLGLAACSGADTPNAGSAATPVDCPAAPVNVTVSVDQWGDIVSQLGGGCADVTTILTGSSIDPHQFEPSPAEAALFGGAELVVINGGHFDEWAARLAATSAPDAPIIDALEVSGADHHHDHHHDHSHDHGDHHHETNPHVWYRPTAVMAVAEAVTAELARLAPDAATYFEKRHTEFTNSLAPYHDRIAAIRTDVPGKTFAATENVFDDMATALGLVNRTPAGYRVASANESDPSPADLDAFLRLLDDRGVDVLIFNSQTQGSVSEQVRAAAQRADIPVVAVTETIPPDSESFQDWQLEQLDALAGALGASS